MRDLDILVAEKAEGGTTIERLSKESIARYENHSLGDMWIKGLIGGTAW
jgi:hypothetical protein